MFKTQKQVTLFLLLCLFIWGNIPSNTQSLNASILEGQEYTPFSEENAQLYYEHSLPILEVSGSHKEMGFLIGKHCKKQISFLLENYMKPLFKNNKKYLLKVAYILEKNLPENIINEMKGISEGSGISYDNILLCNITPDLLQILRCSAFAIDGTLTTDGTPMVARNLDWPSMGNILNKFTLGILYKPTKGNEILSLGWPGLVGVISGINKDGLFCALLTSLSGKEGFNAPSTSILLRILMEESSSTSEFLNKIKDKTTAFPSNIIVSDKELSASIEIDNEKATIRNSKDGYVITTNTSAGEKGITDCYRYNKIERMVIEHEDKMNNDFAYIALDQVDLNLINIQSIVFRPAKMALYISFRFIPAAKGPFEKINLKNVFKINTETKEKGEDNNEENPDPSNNRD